MSSKLIDLTTQVRNGSVSRRQFGQGAAALGLGAAAASSFSPAVFAQEASPAASDVVAIPDFGTENQTRGEAGELRIIQSQAPTVLAAHSSTGSKDTFAGSLVMEPIFAYDLSGELAGRLAATVPSVAEGTLAEDLTSVTVTLKEGVLWSDGEAVTADDVRFTWQWVTNPDNASVNGGVWGVISELEVVDDLTFTATFSSPQVAWFEAFTGVDSGIVYPSHVFGDDPTNKNDEFLSNPIGTGPFKVDSFAPNDAATFSANENYREANKPAFATVTFKGGGDALSAGRAVVQTGDYDYAWNVQAEPEVIAELEANGTAGKILTTVGTTVEGLYLNFSDPHTEVDGQRSEMNTPNPVISDRAVRDALNVAIDRELIAGQFYGGAEFADSNALTGFEYFTSPNTSWTFDLEEAARILDEGGWVLDGDVRSKDGVELSITFASPTNQVRQKTQQVIKADLESIGFAVELIQIDTGVFFDSAAGNDQNSAHFFWDIAMWSSGPPSAIPVAFLLKWYAGPDGENIAQASNGWSQPNYQRWMDAEYDALYDQLLQANTLEAAQELLIALNDRVIEEVAFIPMVRRPFFNAASNRLREENIAGGAVFTSPYWNIANWNLVEE